MNPKTGEILAMVSRPAFNSNLFNDGISEKKWNLLIDNPFNPMENWTISGEYPPGSVFKIITGTAALELGKVTTEEKILDTGKHWLIPKGNAGGKPWDGLILKKRYPNRIMSTFMKWVIGLELIIWKNMHGCMD